MITPDNLFVYGTLKRNNHNHILMSDFTYLCDDAVRGDLYLIGTLPVLTEGDKRVEGQVYAIGDNNKDFDFIDRMEIGARYSRDTITTESGIVCIVYRMSRRQVELISEYTEVLPIDTY